MTTEKTALTTIVASQDGSYLAELLLEKGYLVHGVVGNNSDFTSKPVDRIFFHERFATHCGDAGDTSSLHSFPFLTKTGPTDVYHLAAQSRVSVSFAAASLDWRGGPLASDLARLMVCYDLALDDQGYIDLVDDSVIGRHRNRLQ